MAWLPYLLLIKVCKKCINEDSQRSSARQNKIGQKRAITDDAQADVVRHEEFFLETVDDERHECGDFSLGSTPVFGRKGVEGEKLHPEV